MSEFVAAFAELDRIVRAGTLDASVADTAAAFIEATAVAKTAALLRDDLSRLLAERMDTKNIAIDGVGAFERNHDKNRTQWDHDELWRRVIARARDERQLDPETGEYESEGDAVARVLRKCVSPSWKVTGLREIGLDPDEFAVVEDRGWKARVK